MRGAMIQKDCHDTRISYFKSYSLENEFLEAASSCSREKFERWATEIMSGLDLTKENGVGPNYVATETRWVWIGWQAAFASTSASEEPK